jgi:6,7-dimethyl-8-ribityllumazine synthase
MPSSAEDKGFEATVAALDTAVQLRSINRPWTDRGLA